ncbi:MAG TPA: SRPBCC family protein [Trebonia sp.]|nr:SRPBCC family protein [Trebonia sp.]
MDRLKEEAGGLVSALADRAMSSVKERVEGATGRLSDYVEGEGGPGLMAAVTGAKDLAEGKSPGRAMLGAGWTGLKEKVSGVFGKGKGKGGGKQKLKLTNIVESVEVGVPLRLAYNQWTTYQDFPTFTKKVENARPDANEEQYKVNWKAQIFWSHREWQATIVDQRPDERIVWKSSGQKGHVDGAVTFHELAPNLTKIVVVMEYHPQGLFERTGNLWRAQGRRTRLELKHFQRHVMAHALLNPDDVEGWRGVIEDSRIVKDHETALQEEQEEARQRGEEPAGTAGSSDEAAENEAADEEFTDEGTAAEAPPDEEGGEGEEEDEETRSPGDRRRAPARGGSRGRTPARSRQGTARGTR